eukprot:14179278-Alexandrium_andersonii.AAC.1
MVKKYNGSHHDRMELFRAFVLDAGCDLQKASAIYSQIKESKTKAVDEWVEKKRREIEAEFPEELKHKADVICEEAMMNGRA